MISIILVIFQSEGNLENSVVSIILLIFQSDGNRESQSAGPTRKVPTNFPIIVLMDFGVQGLDDFNHGCVDLRRIKYVFALGQLH